MVDIEDAPSAVGVLFEEELVDFVDLDLVIEVVDDLLLHYFIYLLAVFLVIIESQQLVVRRFLVHRKLLKKIVQLLVSNSRLNLLIQLLDYLLNTFFRRRDVLRFNGLWLFRL